MSDNDFRGRDDVREEYRREERSGRGPRRVSYDDQDDRPRGRRGGAGFSDDQDDRGRGQARGRRSRRRKEDFFEASGTQPNYKEVDTLRRFLTDRAKIRPRRQTGLSSTNQRRLALEIKRARHLALLPFTDDQLRR